MQERTDTSVTKPESEIVERSLEEARGPDLQFFADRRVNGLVDLSVIDFETLNPKQRSIYGSFQRYVHGIMEYGDQSIEHLCLPHRISSALSWENYIRTIEALEARIEEGRHMSRITPKSEQIIKAALAEFHALRSVAEEQVSP